MTSPIPNYDLRCVTTQIICPSRSQLYHSQNEKALHSMCSKTKLPARSLLSTLTLGLVRRPHGHSGRVPMNKRYLAVPSPISPDISSKSPSSPASLFHHQQPQRRKPSHFPTQLPPRPSRSRSSSSNAPAQSGLCLGIKIPRMSPFNSSSRGGMTGRERRRRYGRLEYRDDEERLEKSVDFGEEEEEEEVEEESADEGMPQRGRGRVRGSGLGRQRERPRERGRPRFRDEIEEEEDDSRQGRRSERSSVEDEKKAALWDGDTWGGC